MVRYLDPTVVNNAATWTSEANVLAYDSLYASHSPGATTSWLITGAFTDRVLPDGIEIVGITVELDGRFGEIQPPIEIESPNPKRWEVSLTLNGSTAAATKFASYVTGGLITLGSETDAWDRVWTPSEIASATFGVMVRRGDVLGGEDTASTRYINAIRVAVHFNYDGGSILMADRIVGLQRSVVAPETTPGAGATPTTLLRASKLELAPRPEYTDIAHYGQLVPGDRVLVYESAEGSLAGAPDYNEIGVWLAGRCGRPVSTTLSTGVYRHEFTIDTRNKINPRTYEMHFGSPDDAVSEAFQYVFLRAFGMSFTKKEVSMSGTGMGRRMIDRAQKLGGGGNAVQTLTLSGSPTGGNFTLRFKGAPTTSLSHNATNSAIQAALEALATIGAGNVAVTGSGPFTITFTGALAGKEQPLLEFTNALTGGTSPTPSISGTTKGGWVEYPSAPIVAGKAAVYLATTLAGLPAGKMSQLHKFGFEFTDSFDPVDLMDPDQVSFSDIAEKPHNIISSMGVTMDAGGQTLASVARSQDARYIRVAMTSDQVITSGNPYSLTVDFYGKLKDAGTVEAMGQVQGRNFTVETLYDNAWGQSGRIVLINAVASY